MLFKKQICLKAKTVEKIKQWPDHQDDRQWIPAGRRNNGSNPQHPFLAREFFLVSGKA